MSNQYQGYGFSQGLDRGLLVYHDYALLLEEGMGLGACALQSEGSTYFASINDIKMVNGSYHARYSFDRKLEVTVFGIKLHLITRMQEYLVKNFYMNHEKKQDQLLKLGLLFRKFFRVKNCFARVQSLGEVIISYKLCNNEILVNLSCKTEKQGNCLYVMNELGSSFFDQSIQDGEISPPPSGWQKIERPCELYSSIHRLAFAIVERNVPNNVRSSIYWGREHMVNHSCWAGFENEIIIESGELENYQYSVQFREVAK